MQAVLMSIHYKWIEKMIRGEKTVEVRKTAPKMKPPFKVYIYCTKVSDRDDHLTLHINDDYGREKFGITDYWVRDTDVEVNKNSIYAYNSFEACGRVIGEFICDYIVDSFNGVQDFVFISENCAMSCPDFYNYIGEDECGDTKRCFGWHISHLKIYEKPRKLGEFRKPCKFKTCETCGEFGGGMCLNEALDITRPPQSWQYVEVTE